MGKKEFLDAFENVVKFVKAIESRHIKDIDFLKDKMAKLGDNLKDKNSKDVSNTIAQIEAKRDGFHKEMSGSLNFLRDKVRSLRDGKDADEDKIVEKVLAQVPEPEIFQMGDIGGLEKRLKELEDRPLGGKGGGGTSAIGVRWALGRINNTETPSGLINGSNTTYTVLNEIHTVFSFGINGMVIHSDEYTISSRTIEFGTALPAALSGKSFEIIYV
ncbi:MAG TPA: hypothetical protein ENI23_03305 [bacterium]|nr:hypothetical protein [bacterium]